MEKIREKMEEMGISITELSRMTGISKSSISLYLKGDVSPRPAYLKMMRDALGITSGNPVYRIPVYGTISAGIPLEAITDITDYEEVSPEIYKDVREYFALKIKGVSMNPRMVSGDVVIFHRQQCANNGDVVAVMVGGDDATCKQLLYTDEGITLHAYNPSFGDLVFTRSQVNSLPITILGVAVELRGKLR